MTNQTCALRDGGTSGAVSSRAVRPWPASPCWPSFYSRQSSPFRSRRGTRKSSKTRIKAAIFDFVRHGRFRKRVFSGVVFGARTSILIGVTVALSSAFLGVLVGLTAGYAGGPLDDLLMRITELFLIPPRFFLALVVAALFGSTLFTLILVLGVTYWPSTARLIRAEVLSIRERTSSRPPGPSARATRELGFTKSASTLTRSSSPTSH